MALVEAGESSLSSKVLIVLRNHYSSAANAGGIINRLRKNIRPLRGNAMSEPFAYANAPCVQYRISLRGLENEGLNASNAQTAVRQSIRSAFDVESGAFRAVISDIQE